MASSGRVLIAATITEVGNNSFLYPACQLCYSKLLTSDADLFQCQKCNVTYYPVEAYYRYSLHATISDGTCLAEVTSFGGMLDRFFGSSCSEFYHKYVLKLREKYGQASDVILQTAVEKTFIGQNLIFGFKARLPNHNEIVTLKDICESKLASYSSFPRTLPCLIAVQILHQTNSTFTHTVIDHLQAILTKIETCNLSENDCMGKYKLYRLCSTRDIQPTGIILNADTLSGMCLSVSSSCSVIEDESSVALSCDNSLNDSKVSRNYDNNPKSPNSKANVENKSEITPVKKLECLIGKSTNLLDNLLNKTTENDNYSKGVILNQSIKCCSVEQYSSSRGSFGGEEIGIENVDPSKKDNVTWCVKSYQLQHQNLEKTKAQGDRCTSKNSHLSGHCKLEDISLSERVEQTSDRKVNMPWSCYDSLLNRSSTKEPQKNAAKNCEKQLSQSVFNDSSQHLAELDLSTKGVKEILCSDPTMLDMPESEGLDTFLNTSDVGISTQLAHGVNRHSECVSQATQQPELAYDKKEEISNATIDKVSEDCDQNLSAVNAQFISSNITLRRSRKFHSTQFTIPGLSDFEQLLDTSHEMSDYLLAPYKSLDTPSYNVLVPDKSLDFSHELLNGVLVPDGSSDVAQEELLDQSCNTEDVAQELLDQSCNTEADQSEILELPDSEDLSKFLTDISKEGTINKLTHNMSKEGTINKLTWNCSLSPAVGEKITSNKLENSSLVVKACKETESLLQTILTLEDGDICSEDMFESPVTSHTREPPKHLDTDVVTADTDVVTADTDVVTADTDAVTGDTDVVTADTDVVTADTDVVTADTDVVTADTDVVTADDNKDHTCHKVELSNPGASTCLKLPSRRHQDSLDSKTLCMHKDSLDSKTLCRQQDSLDHKLAHNKWQGPEMKQIFFHPSLPSPVSTQHEPVPEYKNYFPSLQRCTDHQRERSENKTESHDFNSSVADVSKIIAESWLEENGHDSELGYSEDLFESQDNHKAEEELCDKQGVNKCDNSYISKHTNSSVTKNGIEKPFKNTHLEPIDCEAKISAKKVRFTQTTEELCFNAASVISNRPVTRCAVNVRSCLKKQQTEKSRSEGEKSVSSWLSQDLFSSSCCEAPSPATSHRESTNAVLPLLSPSATSDSTVETSSKLNHNTSTTLEPTWITEPFCSTPLTHKPSYITGRNCSTPLTLHYRPTYIPDPHCSTPRRHKKPNDVDTSQDLFSPTFNSPVVGSCLSAHAPPTDLMTPDLFD
ncbi:uncharacterized protein LOC131935087 [Physella acuta]|uniref:uncharacterized protein LOC131935087 n=1 Tax=Physella acuta TaxID=109671 RepID=UPI0027DB5C8E|nr:uncharacterized protein LOC131935087 [Physella acuta]